MSGALKSWTKDLDLRLVRIVQKEYGEEIRSAPRIDWKKVADNLDEAWPKVLRSAQQLRNRWRNNLLVWYAKAQSTASSSPASRASTISIPRLIELITNRDYATASKRGRKRKSQEAVTEEADDESQDQEEEEDDDDGEEEEEDDDDEEEDHNDDRSGSLSSLLAQKARSTPSAQVEKAVSAAGLLSADSGDGEVSAPLARRLDSWLRLLNDPLVQESFVLHFHSDIDIEPAIIMEALSRGGIAEPFSHLLTLMRAISSEETVQHILALTDREAISQHVEKKLSCLLVPCSDIYFGSDQLVLSTIIYPSSPVAANRQQSIFCCILVEKNASANEPSSVQANAADVARVRQLMGLSPARDDATIYKFFKFYASETTSDMVLLGLYLLQGMVQLMSNSELSVLESTLKNMHDHWPNDKNLRRKLLSNLLIDSRAALLLAPPTGPLSTTFDGVVSALQSVGLSLPPWCLGFSRKKRESMLEAIRDVKKTLVVVLKMDDQKKEPSVTTWNRRSDDQKLIVLAERNKNAFGVIFAIQQQPSPPQQQEAENRAQLVLHANREAIRKLQVNARALPVSQQEHMLDLVVKTVIDFQVEDLKGRLIIS